MHPLYDLHTMQLVLVIAFAGGIIGLDRTALGQIMVSQPIVAGPITGWLLGDVAAGIMIGGVLELIWVLDMPVGTFVPADATVGAIAATAIAVLGSNGGAGLDVIGFCLLLTTVMVPVTMAVDLYVRKRNSGLAEAACSRDCSDPAGGLARSQAMGLVFFFLKSFVLYLVLVPAGLAAVRLFGAMPTPVHSGMALFVKLLPLLGAALVLHKMSFAVLDRFLIWGFGVAAVLTLLLPAHPLVIVLCITAAGLAGARTRERIFPVRAHGGRR
jgi:mannose/fructose/N-acetylgalactosamine-specific phosphotransferase system component IIC